MSLMSSPTAGRQRTLFVFFFLPGLSMATWVTRTPAIRDALGATIAEMGMVLLGLSIGSMTGILSAGVMVRKVGTRTGAYIGLWFVVVALLTIAFGVFLQQALVVALGLGFFGLGLGLSEIAINVDGADLERVTSKAILHALHGFFSLGTVIGALIGIGLNLIHFPVMWHLAAIAALCVPLIMIFIRFIPHGLGLAERSSDVDIADGPAQHLWRDTGLLLIGLIVLGMALAEGAANDWLPLLMVDEYGMSPTAGSLIFLGFATAMTIGRFGGGFFLARFGRAIVIRACALLGAMGLLLVVFGNNPILVGIAVFLWGIGASLGFPVALSAAGDSGPNPTERVRLVAMVGYIAFLVGPPLLGFVGEQYGLRNAMIIVLALLGVAALASSSVRSKS